jgi:hypothetical protein
MGGLRMTVGGVVTTVGRNTGDRGRSKLLPYGLTGCVP